MNKFFFIILLSLWSISLYAAIDVYQFQDLEKQHRFQTLTAELRCPKCQNQNLADSNSEIATDLRMKVYQMLKKNQSDAVIVDYMLERYGEFVLYKPRVIPQTLLLWYGPMLLLLIGGVIVGLILYYRRQQITSNKAEITLNHQQQHTLTTLLKTTHRQKK